MRQCADGIAGDDPAMIEYLLEFRGGLSALVQGKVSPATHVDWIERPEGPVIPTERHAELIRSGYLKRFDRLGRFIVVQCEKCAKLRQVTASDRSILGEALSEIICECLSS